MTDKDKTKEQLITEMAEMRQRIRELERSETQRKRAQAESSKESDEKLRAICSSAKDAIIMMDSKGRVAYCNRAMEEIFGYEAGEVIGQDLHRLLVPEKFHQAFKRGFERFKETGQGKAIGRTLEFSALRRDGTEFPIELSLSGIKIKGKWHATGIVRDITKRRRLETELHMLAIQDELTKLYNRRGFFTVGEQQWKIARREKKVLSLIFADLDDMKGINDTFGHEKGDQALKEAASILLKTFRESDIIARVGGDEFAVLSMQESEDDTKILTNRLQKNLDRVNRRRPQQYRLSVSLGMSCSVPEHPRSLTELLTVADKQMYEHKNLKENNLAQGAPTGIR